MLNHTDLKLIIFSASSQTLTEVSEKMSLTLSAVSIRISQIETKMGVKILRRGKPIRLTDAGQLMYRFAVRQLAEFDMLQTEFARLQNQFIESIHILASPLIASYDLPLVVDVFYDRFPAVICAISSRPQPNDSFDLRIHHNTVANQDTYKSDELVLVCNQDHALAQRSHAIELSELNRHRLIRYADHSDLNQITERIKTATLAVAPDFTTALNLTAAISTGAMLAPESAATATIGHQPLRMLRFASEKVIFYTNCVAQNDSNETANQFRKLLKSRFKRSSNSSL